MRLIIQKFGGSSLSSKELREKAIEHILAAKAEGYTPVVVVSAMGRKGDPYATDTLLEFIREIAPSFPLRETDLVLSCGELISAAVLAAQVGAHGVKALALSGAQAGIVTDGVFGQAEIIRIKKEKILRLAQDGHVPIVAGFQGSSEEGEINTLGRGGSDTTAVALGAAMEAEVVEIYSDVDCIMTADPRIVPEAKPIGNIGYQEVLQMAREGAKVIHPRAVDIALQYNLPLRLKKTGSYDSGTLVTHKKPQLDKSFISREKVVNGITHVTGLAQARVLAPQASGEEIETMLQELSDAGISIDLINLSPQEKAFTVPAAAAEQTKSIIASLGYEAIVNAGYAKVSVVGAGMRGIPGVMARVVSAMNKAQTDILQTADSHLNISCLIPENRVAAAVKALHLEFNLNE
ncbi:aspartate kinase [Dethiobacter alkaliphilus]|uniref:Aspartokinase n=1 Tax=Dethiobacter alkaliphilus AHT 1 TaxID=555088 RepID=C0GIY0_DETAL|nr:aspartate kinase [Dethiobacter alkaliphilus]EEG76794.1 aspartate kinase [Dethiobacter alkaliphilus AHT 1]